MNEVHRLERAVELAARAHAGQVDKQGQPYLLHALRVMLAVPPELRPVAVLHDVGEDSVPYIPQVRTLLTDAEWETFDALTRRPGEQYSAYLARVLRVPAAIVVKRADIADHLARVDELEPRDRERLGRRYRKARVALDLALGLDGGEAHG